MADNVKLASLRVEATLDASGYAAGAAQKAAADKQMVAGADQVATSVDATQRKVTTSSTAFDRFQRSLDPVFASQQNVAKGAETIQRALDRGLITTDRATQLTALLTERYKPAIDGAKGLGDAHDLLAQKYKLSFVEGEILRSGLINTIQSLVAGEGAARTLQTQLFQTAPAFSGLAKSVGLSGTAVLSGAAALAVIGGALVLGIARATTLDTEIRQLTVSLRAMGGVSDASAHGLQGISQQLKATGSSADDARAVALQLARSGLSSSDANTAATLGRDISAGLGVSTSQGVEKVIDVIRQGVPAIKALDDQVNFLTVDQTRNIRTMAEHGDKAGALSLAIDALKGRFDGLHTAGLSPTQQASVGLTNAWDNLLNKLANTTSIKVAQQAIAGLLNGAAWLASSSPSASGNNPTDALQRAQDRLAQFRDATKNYRDQGAEVMIPGFGFGAPSQIGSGLEDQVSTARTIANAGVSYGTQFGPNQPGQNPGDAANTKQIDAMSEANNKLSIAYQKVGTARQLAIAQIDAETEAASRFLSPQNAANLLKEKQREVTIQATGAAIEETAQARLSIASTLDVAAAYSRSAAEGVQADALRTASLAHLQNSIVDVGQRQREILVGQAADAAAEAQKQARALDGQTASANTAADAILQGGKAVADANLHNQIYNQTLVAQTALDAISQNNDIASLRAKIALRAGIDSLTKSITDSDDVQRKATTNNALVQSRDSLAVAQAELSTVGETTNAREEDLAVLQQTLALKRTTVGVDSKAGQEILNNTRLTVEAQQQANLQLQRFQDLKQAGKDAFDAIGDGLINGITQGEHFKDTLKGIEQQLAAMILKNAVLKPAENALFGQGGGGGLLDGFFRLLLGGGGGSPAAGNIDFGAEAGGFGNALAGIASAKGNVFYHGNLQPFAAGGVVTRPTYFPMAGGNAGLMGEAGPEAIMPLTRGPDGRLGVSGGGRGGDTHYYSIDARGSTDPATIEAAINRAMQKSIPGIVRVSSDQAVTKVRDLNRRGSLPLRS